MVTTKSRTYFGAARGARTREAVLEDLLQGLDRSAPQGGHARRVEELVATLGIAFGAEPDVLHELRLGARLHDVGKSALPSVLWSKPGPLTARERQIMMKHPGRGASLLAPLGLPPRVLDMVLHHHERWDGGGYPSGLIGLDIPWAARLLAVCDVFDALTSDRPYRRAWEERRVLGYLRRQGGRAFDPVLTAAFVELRRSRPGS